MRSLRSYTDGNDYTTATTNNAWLVQFPWHACGCLSGEYLHAHTFIYMQQSVLIAVQVPICAQAIQRAWLSVQDVQCIPFKCAITDSLRYCQAG